MVILRKKGASMALLGQCPYCTGKVFSKKITVKNKNVKLYACEHAKKEYDESEAYVYSADSTCTFMVYSNAFLRWNKRSFSEYEMKSMLQEGQAKVRLYSRAKQDEYFKYVIPDKEYGVSVLWDEE